MKIFLAMLSTAHYENRLYSQIQRPFRIYPARMKSSNVGMQAAPNVFQISMYAMARTTVWTAVMNHGRYALIFPKVSKAVFNYLRFKYIIILWWYQFSNQLQYLFRSHDNNNFLTNNKYDDSRQRIFDELFGFFFFKL